MGVKTLYEYFYKLAYGAKGTIEHQKYVDNLDIADAQIEANKNRFINCADYDHPDDAITAIGASNKTLLVTEAETCDTNFTVPANVTVKFERGGKWTINGTGGSYITSAVFVGSGLNDATSGGTFTGGADTYYKLQIDGVNGIKTSTLGVGGTSYAVDDTFTVNTGSVLATGKVLTVNAGVVLTYEILTSGSGYTVANGVATTATLGTGTGLTINITVLHDTFKWSDDGGSTWDATVVAMTGAAQTLNNGVTITFGAIVGHTLTNYWTFTGCIGIKVIFNGQIDAGLWQIFEYAGTGTLAGSPLNNYAYPQWLGALGNGIDDDATAIQNTINFMDTVFCPKGDYLIKAGIHLLDNTTIQGVGRTTKFIIASDADTRRTYDSVEDNNAGLFFNDDLTNGNDNIQLLNFMIDGSSNDGTTAGMGIGCYALPATGLNTNWLIENIYTYQTAKQAIFLRQVDNHIIRDCEVNETRLRWADGMSAHGGSNVSFIGNKIFSSIDDAIALESIIQGVVVGNIIDRDDTYVTFEETVYTAHAINIVGSSNITVGQNTMINCRTTEHINRIAAIVVSSAAIACEDITIIGNTLDGATRGIQVSGALTSGVTIIGNIITDVDGSAVMIDGASNIVINSNTIRDCVLTTNIGVINVKTAYEVTPFVQINGNLIENTTISTYYGIVLDACSNSSITNNQIKNHSYGIKVMTSGTNFLIGGNMLTECTGHGILLEGTTDNFIISNNKLKATGGSYGIRTLSSGSDFYAFNNKVDGYTNADNIGNTAKLSAFALTTSAEFAEAISDETGTLKLVFADSPTFTTKIITPIIDLTGGQIAFPATQVPSAGANTLDDYEEGTWTGAFTCGTSGTITLDASYQTGTYVKTGKTVTISGIFMVTSVSSPLGSLTLTGLPFTCSSGNQSYSAISVFASNLETTATTQIMAGININATTINFRHFASGSAPDDMAADIKATSYVRIGGSYFTD